MHVFRGKCNRCGTAKPGGGGGGGGGGGRGRGTDSGRGRGRVTAAPQGPPGQLSTTYDYYDITVAAANA